MKVFVAYGFTANNQWVKDLLYPLVESFGAEVVHGEDVQGESISNAVLERIRGCNALIGILTRVEKITGQDYYTPRSWVLQELAAARSANKLFIEVRDRKLDPNRGMLSDTQPILFSEDESKERLLVQLTAVLARWRRKLRKQRICLVPSDIARQIYRNRLKPGTFCRYQFRTGFNDTTPQQDAKIEKHVEAVCIHVEGFPDDDDVYIEIAVTSDQNYYTTGWQPINMLNLSLEL